MQTPGFRPLDRGEFSILAAFTLVVVLAGAGLFLQNFTPTPVSQTAATEATAGIKTDCQQGTVSKVAISAGKVTNLTDKPIVCWNTASDGTTKTKTNDPNCGGADNYVNQDDCRVEACVPANVSPTKKKYVSL
jgi:hypothetical protein